MTKKKIKFSVIIKTYNSEKNVMRSVQSVLLQSIGAAEIIVVEGKSNDTTPIVISELVSSGFIIAIKPGKSDDAGAMNRALRLATGNYILFMDAEQWLECDYLECINKYLSKHNQENRPDFIFINNENVDLNKTNEEIILSKETLPPFLEEIYSFGSVSQLDCKLYSTEIIKKGNVKFDQDTIGNEGLFFNLNFFCNAKSILILREKRGYNGKKTQLKLNKPTFCNATLQKEHYIFVTKMLLDRFSLNNSTSSYPWYIKRMVSYELSIIISMFYSNKSASSVRKRIDALRLYKEKHAVFGLFTKKERLIYSLLLSNSFISYHIFYVIYVAVFISRL